MKRIIPCILVFHCLLACGVEVKQFFRPERFVRTDENVRRIQPIDEAAWIWSDAPVHWGVASVGPDSRWNRDTVRQSFLRFRKRFESSGETLRFDVSADERFVLFLDGSEIARGPHRGMPEHWYYQSYEAELSPGGHLLEAVVWQIGAHAPLAQLSWRGGFILKAEGVYDAQLTTGRADWQVAELSGTRMTGQGESRAWGVGSEVRCTGTSFADERPTESAYRLARSVRRAIDGNCNGLRTEGWMLFPTVIPDQLQVRRRPGSFKAVRVDVFEKAPFVEADTRSPLVRGFDDLLQRGVQLKVPAHGSIRAVWDLGNYYCGYPELIVSGGKGSEIRWKWAESLLDGRGRKGDRAAVVGKTVGKMFGDVFICDGRLEASFSTPWWRCGRWCQIEVKAGDEPVLLKGISILETRYPAEPESSFVCDDETVADVIRICTRGLQMCTHEMFFDCPYYEQQMYPGDSRVQFLSTFALHSDSRLIRQSTTLFDEARRPNGLLPMNFPSRMTQESGTYTMCWINMLRDYVMWRGDKEWMCARLPGMRQALESIRRVVNADGLIGNLPGWSFTDYTLPWREGVPPVGRKDGLSAILSLQYLYALRSAVVVERAIGEGCFADLYARQADGLAQRICERFWSTERGMIADTSDKDCFSEQAQCLAILADALPSERRQEAFRGLVESRDLTPATVYFTHYLFDAYFAFNRSDLFFRRLDLWRRYVKLNMNTLQEKPESATRDPRSDCHAWGAHPLYHLQAHVAGVQPGSPHFRTVRISPQPGPLSFFESRTPTPSGAVVQSLRFDNGVAKGRVILPRGLSGVFDWQGVCLQLCEGVNEIDVGDASGR